MKIVIRHEENKTQTNKSGKQVFPKGKKLQYLLFLYNSTFKEDLNTK